MKTIINLSILCFFASFTLHSQETEIDRLINNEFKMTFPSIHFKHKSTYYASMPYTVDSCIKHIAMQFDETVNELVIGEIAPKRKI